MTSVHRGLDIRIFAKECCSLAEAGYETHLVATAPIEDIEKAAARNVTLHALPAPTGRLARMVNQAWRCYRAARDLDADTYHFHDPELIPYGMLLKRAGKRVVYDVHEDLPRDILDKDWIPVPLRRIISWGAERVENYVACRLDGVVAATPRIAKRFDRINAHAVNINNYPMPEELAPFPCTRERKRQICYVGGITRIRGIEPLIRALSLVPGVTLILCGRFQEAEFERAMRALPGWAQVEYRGHVDRSGVRRVLSESMAGIVTFLPIPAHVDALPTKMFEYMSAELPVIVSDFPLWREIVDGARAGLCVDPQSPEAIAVAIRALVNDPMAIKKVGEAGRRAVLAKYNWLNEAKKLVSFYEELH